MSSDNVIKIDHTNINQFIQDRAPYLFVDKAEVIAGKSAKGEKYVANNEWYFQAHFPNNPIMPGVFQLEAIMQTASMAIYVLGNHIDFVYANKFNTTVSKPVYPGCLLYIDTTIQSFKRGIIKGFGETYFINDKNEKEVTCSTDFTMLVPAEIEKNSPMRKG